MKKFLDAMAGRKECVVETAGRNRVRTQKHMDAEASMQDVVLACIDVCCTDMSKHRIASIVLISP